MLAWVLALFVIAMEASWFGFGEISAGIGTVAKVLLAVYLASVLFKRIGKKSNHQVRFLARS